MVPGTLVIVTSTMVTSICTAYYEYILAHGVLFGLGVGMLSVRLSGAALRAPR